MPPTVHCVAIHLRHHDSDHVARLADLIVHVMQLRGREEQRHREHGREQRPTVCKEEC